MMQELLDYAASSQDEVCGLILDGGQLFRCRNVHPEPGKHFRISDDEWLAAEEAGEVTAAKALADQPCRQWPCRLRHKP